MNQKQAWKAAALAAAAAGMVLLAGCGGGEKKEEAPAPSAPQGKILQQIKERGKMIVATASGYPPYEFVDVSQGDKTVIGVDMELAKAIADKIGVTLEIQDMNFQSVLASLASGKVDIAISGINPTDERRKTVDFSDIYLPTEQMMLIRKEDAAKYQKLEDFYGKNIAVQKSTTQEHIANEEIKDAKIVALAHVPEAVLELKHGKADGVVVEGICGKQYLIYNDDLMFAEGVHFQNGIKNSAAALQKGNEDFLAIVNEVIKENTDNGNFKKWEEEYIQKSVENARLDG